MQHKSIKSDYCWMAKAIQLAKKGLYTTSPNPRVGCVIVDENNQCIGEGFHIQAGTPHAEVHALKQAAKADKNTLSNATAYVTLEPCSHYGRTPPCAEALIKADIGKVVIAMTDPNPNVSGNGIRKLQEAGIEVVSGVMAAEAAAINPGFIKRMLTGKPFVRVKLGISLDGKIALENGVSQWITGPEARRDVQRYRASSCCVLTGSGTVIADDPSLLVRANEAQFSHYPLERIRQPTRVVVDSKEVVNSDYQCLADGNTTLIATINPHPDTAARHYLTVTPKQGRVDLDALMQSLGDKQYNEVWVEAGPGLAGALLDAGLVDEFICYQAPMLLGNKGMSMVNLPSYTSIEQSISLTLIENRQVGNDIKLVYRPDTDSSRD